MKLLLEEPETSGLEEYLASSSPSIVVSSLALVEVPRATALAHRTRQMAERTEARLRSCELVAVTHALLRHAARLAPSRLRALDAIHLASALAVEPDEMLVYDVRLAEAARAAGLTVVQPGRNSPDFK